MREYYEPDEPTAITPLAFRAEKGAHFDHFDGAYYDKDDKLPPL